MQQNNKSSFSLLQITTKYINMTQMTIQYAYKSKKNPSRKSVCKYKMTS